MGVSPVRLLLDTHALIWWFAGDARLSSAARAAVEDPAHPKLVSAASAWEIATKHRLGRLPEVEAVGLAGDVRGAVAAEGFEALPITLADAERAGRLARALPRPIGRHADRPDARADRGGVRRLRGHPALVTAQTLRRSTPPATGPTAQTGVMRTTGGKGSCGTAGRPLGSPFRTFGPQTSIHGALRAASLRFRPMS